MLCRVEDEDTTHSASHCTHCHIRSGHTHYSEGEGHLLREGVSRLPSGLAGSGSEEEGASLTWTGGNTAGEGERERKITTGHTC